MNTAYSAGPGEPNTLCDLLAATISEEYQKRDGAARTDIRISGGRGALFITGLVSSSADFDVRTLVKQVLGSIDPSLSLEPFIAIDSAGELKRPSIQTTGYATNETPTLLPRAVDTSLGVTRILEDVRKANEGWFWRSPDFDVTVKAEGKNMNTHIRVSHIDTVGIEDVRGQVTELFDGRLENIQINTAGADHRNGLAGAIGSSGQGRFWYGARMPAMTCLAGAELSHPANIGWMIARYLAKDLVRRGEGQAVMVDMFWQPLEDIPRSIQARNEKGEDLSPLILRDRLSRKRLSEKWGLTRPMSGLYRFSFDGAIDLPFEQEDFLS